MSDLGVAVRTQWGLIGEWWCVDAVATEIAIAEEIARSFISADGPVRDVMLVRDRLFGGYPCEAESGRKHVYFATGCYTYTNPHRNTPLSDEDRRAQWARIVELNGEPGSGPFTGW